MYALKFCKIFIRESIEKRITRVKPPRIPISNFGKCKLQELSFRDKYLPLIVTFPEELCSVFFTARPQLKYQCEIEGSCDNIFNLHNLGKTLITKDF